MTTYDDVYLTVEEAEDLAAGTLTAIAKKFEPWLEAATPWLAADRERLASDLDLLRETYINEYIQASLSITIFLRRTASDGLRRTAALYVLSDPPARVMTTTLWPN